MKTKQNDTSANGSRDSVLTRALLHDVAHLLHRVVPRTDDEARAIEQYINALK